MSNDRMPINRGKPAEPGTAVHQAPPGGKVASLQYAPTAVIHSIRPREPIHLVGVNQIQTLEPLKPDSGVEVAVAGPSVFVLVKNGNAPKELPGHQWLVELPRQMCIIRWLVPAEVGIDDVVKLVQGGGGPNTPHVSPPEGMRKR